MSHNQKPTLSTPLAPDEFVIAHLLKRAAHEPEWTERMLSDRDFFDEGLVNLRIAVDELIDQRASDIPRMQVANEDKHDQRSWWRSIWAGSEW